MTKFFVSLAFTIASISTVYSQKVNYKASIISFYNLENLYDTVNNPLVDDEEFLPASERHYNTRIYLDKLNRLTDVISQLGTDINPDGIALLGVAEIENDTVLTDLVNHKTLKNRKLKFVQYNSPALWILKL